MIPLKTFGILLAKSFSPKNKNKKMLEYIMMPLLNFSFDEHLCSSPEGRPLSQRYKHTFYSHLLALRPQNDCTKQHKRLLFLCFSLRIHVYILSVFFFSFFSLLFPPQDLLKHSFFQPGDCIVALLSVLMSLPCLLIPLF